MKRLRAHGLVLAACLALAVATPVLSAGVDQAEEVTLTGEIIDLHCYMLHPETGHGSDHAKCANQCIERGLPVGFLADGRAYVLLGPGQDAPASVVSGRAGRPVRVTGKLVEHGGMAAIQIASVEEADAPASRPHHGHGHGHDHGDHDHDH